MSRVLPPDVRRARNELVRHAASAPTVAEVFAVAAARLRRLVPHDAAAWLSTDPATGLPTAPTRIEGVHASAELCSEHWRHEFVSADVNRFRELANAPVPASALRAAAVDPRRSRRFRRFLRPQGFGDELRAVLRSGEASWATVTLWRHDGRAPFSRSEVELVAGLSDALGDTLRHRVRDDLAVRSPGARERPGLLLFDEAGRLTSASEHAVAWLDELPAEDRVSTDLGVELPVWLLLCAIRARESFLAGGDGTAGSRVRSRSGRWLLCPAATTTSADGSPAATALVIEPASPARMAPIAVEAYGLTGREQEVTRLIARGVGTDQIARRLHLSPHTVKDHVKAVLRKVGVATRGELVAALYAEFYEPGHLAEVTRARSH